MPKRKQDNSAEYVQNGILVIAMGLLAFALSFFVQPKITITILLLLFVWVIDAFIKKSYGFGSETVFADLSFACLAYTGGKGFDLFLSNLQAPLDIDTLAILSSTFFGLFIFWIGNLIVSRGFNNRGLRGKPRVYVWLMSSLLGLISFIGTIMPMALNLI